MTAPPIPDVDWVAVHRAIGGDTAIPLNGDELRHAWQELERQGHDAHGIGRTLGVSYRRVQRWRAGQAVTRGRRAAPR